MNRLKHKVEKKLHRKDRVRSKTKGTTERPRLSVFISNRNVTAQIIDDAKGKTEVFVTTSSGKNIKGSMTEKAAAVGKELAKQAKSKKVKRVVFDRGPKLYHGRVKALADAAREEGLEF